MTPTPTLERKRGALGVLWVLLRGARPNTPMYQLSSYAKPWSVQRWILRFALLHELTREVCRSWNRIQEMHSRAEDEQGVELTWLRAFPVDDRDAMILAHNEGIRSLQNRFPWMTAFDVGLYRQGFAAGASF
jgi:hypothetical protein